MSDAKVTFQTMNYVEEADGAAAPGKEARFAFACPKHANRRCEGLIIVGEASGVFRTPEKTVPAWEFDGNRDRPTFTPSINCGGCWHGYVQAGRCVDVNYQDEPEPANV